jgi:hypothetical protein
MTAINPNPALLKCIASLEKQVRLAQRQAAAHVQLKAAYAALKGARHSELVQLRVYETRTIPALERKLKKLQARS